jgi:hypothetical protein
LHWGDYHGPISAVSLKNHIWLHINEANAGSVRTGRGSLRVSNIELRPTPHSLAELAGLREIALYFL